MRSSIGWLPKVGNSNSARFCRVRLLALVLCATFLAAAALLPANVVEARVWTFVDGTTADARYVRSRDDYVWLQAGRQRKKFSLDQIEAGDQMWVRMRELKQVDRTWTKSWGNTKHVGRFLRFRDGKVHIEGESETVEIEFAKLIPKDQTLILAILATHGKEDRVPSTFAAVDPTPNSDPADWQAIDDVRIWTNVAGKQRQGKMERVTKDSRGLGMVVFLDKKTNQETQLYFHELSDTDQQYVIAKTSSARKGSGTRSSNGSSGYNAQHNGSPHSLKHREDGPNVPADLEQHEADSRTWKISDAPHPALQPKVGALSPAKPLAPAARSLEERRRSLPVVQPDGSTLFPGGPYTENKDKPLFVDREPLVTTSRPEAQEKAKPAANRQLLASPNNVSGHVSNHVSNHVSTTAPRNKPTPEAIVLCGNCGQQFSSQEFSVGSTCPHCGRTVHQLHYADGHVERSLGYWKPFLLGGTILIAIFSAWAYVRAH